MKKCLLLTAMLLAALTGCAGGSKPQPAPSDEVLIAQEDSKIRAAIVQVVQAAPSLGLPASLALVSAAKGLPQLRFFAYTSNVCTSAAPCSVPPAAGADSPVLSNDGPRGPVDQRKAPISLPGPVR